MPGRSVTSAVVGIIGGSTAAAVIAFFTSSRIERQRFDYQIIQQALQADSQVEREGRLQFLVEAGFIQDTSLEKRLITKLHEKAKLPRLPGTVLPLQSAIDARFKSRGFLGRTPISSEFIMIAVRQFLVEQLGVKPETVTPTARLIEDLGADELDLNLLVLAFEEEFAIEIKDEDIKLLQTVGDVIAYVTAHSKRVSH